MFRESSPRPCGAVPGAAGCRDIGRDPGSGAGRQGRPGCCQRQGHSQLAQDGPWMSTVSGSGLQAGKTWRAGGKGLGAVTPGSLG